MKVTSITPELMVRDATYSLKFYTESLGFTADSLELDNGELVWAQIKFGRNSCINIKSERKLRPELEYFRSINIGASVSICIQIDTIEAFYNSLPDYVEIIEGLHVTSCNLNQFSIVDPDGYLLTFMEVL